MGKTSTSAKWILWTLLICQNVFSLNVGLQILTENNTLLRNPLGTKLAVGGMLHGMLNIQIRPHGGFYEEKYKEIFQNDHSNLMPNEDKEKEQVAFETRSHPSNLVQNDSTNPLPEDGKLLEAMSSGKADNPCFEAERISRNRLLALLCSVRLQKELLSEKRE